MNSMNESSCIYCGQVGCYSNSISYSANPSDRLNNRLSKLAKKGDQVIALLFERILFNLQTGNPGELDSQCLFHLSTANKLFMEKSKNIWKIEIKKLINETILKLLINDKLHLNIELTSFNLIKIYSQISRLFLKDPSLFGVIHNNYIELFNLLISAGADIDTCDYVTQEPLVMYAAKQPNVNCFLALIRAGAAIDIPEGLTPLIYMLSPQYPRTFSPIDVKERIRECVATLLNFGADPTAVKLPFSYSRTILTPPYDPDFFKTAFDLAFKYAPETIPLFITAIAAHGRIENFNANTSLLIIMTLRNEEYVRACLGAGANIDATDGNGHTALMVAIINGRRDTVQTLIGAGADVNLRDNSGQTALGIARQQEEEEIIRMLENVGATE